jgi:hypothetical protein
MTHIADIHAYQPRGQCIIMLFCALEKMRTISTKQEAIAYIAEKRWFDIQPEDRIQYRSQTTNEARWKTLIAFSRKDGVETELMFDHPRDQWELNRDGYAALDGILSSFRSGSLKATRCFLWSENFKKHVVPDYRPEGAVFNRPKNFYRDFAFAPRHRLNENMFQVLDDLGI